mmetsp:Transcript_15305/g.25224  ORF Transcript_15305/g.25224 Transcript_15305/m.25224 type:complete len:374 (+) Transcript_15305:3-1124(+)
MVAQMVAQFEDISVSAKRRIRHKKSSLTGRADIEQLQMQVVDLGGRLAYLETFLCSLPWPWSRGEVHATRTEPEEEYAPADVTQQCYVPPLCKHVVEPVVFEDRGLPSQEGLAATMDAPHMPHGHVQGLTDVCAVLDLLQNELCNTLYLGSLLADCNGSHDMHDISPAESDHDSSFVNAKFLDDFEVQGERFHSDLEDLRARVWRALDQFGEAAEFFDVNAESFSSLDDAMDLYGSFYAMNRTGHQFEQLTAGILARPSNIALEDVFCISAVVRFESEDDENGMDGWSPFLLAWPSGRVGKARLTNARGLSPPQIDDYGITITANAFIFDELSRGDGEFAVDDEEISVVGDAYGIFQNEGNLAKIVSLAFESD